jgi:hypothetical protein
MGGFDDLPYYDEYEDEDEDFPYDEDDGDWWDAVPEGMYGFDDDELEYLYGDHWEPSDAEEW